MPGPEGSPRRASVDDAVRRLEERLSRASETAERLIREAADSVAGEREPREPPPGQPPRRPPPMGWQRPEDAPGDGARGSRRPHEDLALLLELATRVRDLVPAELQNRLAEALRELLLAVRAVIDFYLERSERRRREPPEVTEIPID